MVMWLKLTIMAVIFLLGAVLGFAGCVVLWFQSENEDHGQYVEGGPYD